MNKYAVFLTTDTNFSFPSQGIAYMKLYNILKTIDYHIEKSRGFLSRKFEGPCSKIPFPLHAVSAV